MSAGSVTAIRGHAYVRGLDGQLKALHVGDRVVGGERIITDDNGMVEILPLKAAAALLAKPAVAPLMVDKAITGFDTPDEGIEAGWESTHWSAQLAVSNGTAGGPETDKGKQGSLRAEYVSSIWRAGVSVNYNDADAGERRMQGLFAGLRTGPIAWLAEADYLVDDSFADGTRHQWVGLIEANWGVAAGHNLKLTAEDISKLDKVSQPPLIYPYWHQSFTAQDRMGAADLALHKPYMD